MATRYSGRGRVRLQWDDAAAAYHCVVSVLIRGRVHFGDRRTITVGAPAALTRAVDSPEAYDDAARAAIAFATDSGGAGRPLDADAFDWDPETGRAWVGRSRESAYQPLPLSPASRGRS